MGERDVVGKVEKGDIGVDGWYVVGIGSVTGSGVLHTVCWSCDSWGRSPMDIESLGLVEALTASCEP
jgi:hypothetical protein